MTVKVQIRFNTCVIEQGFIRSVQSYSIDKNQTSASIWWSLIARFMGPAWGPSGADRAQVVSTLAPWTLLSGIWRGAVHRIFCFRKHQQLGRFHDSTCVTSIVWFNFRNINCQDGGMKLMVNLIIENNDFRPTINANLSLQTGSKR